MSVERGVLVIDKHEVVAKGCQLGFVEAGMPWHVIWQNTWGGLSRVDLVVADLWLSDESFPGEGVSKMKRAGIPTVIYTAADDPYLVREAIKAGVSAVIRKSAPMRELVSAAQSAMRGASFGELNWADVVGANGDFATECLTESEARVLARYALGGKSESVARELALSKNTVDTYIARIRAKYHAAGRRADSRVALYLRAVEDGLVSPTSTRQSSLVDQYRAAQPKPLEPQSDKSDSEFRLGEGAKARYPQIRAG